MKNILITGVSSGIGLATAQKFLNSNFRVFGSVRKKADATDLKQKLGENFIPLIFDVNNAQDISDAKTTVIEMIGEQGLDCLINNAGIAVTGPILHIPIEEFHDQLEINVIGTLRVIQEFTPLLKGNEETGKQPGRIINISSLSGLIARPLMGPYSASKFALEAMSDALRRELMIYGIKVILIEPGPIKTPIWKKAAEFKNHYLDTDYANIISHLNRQIKQIEHSALPVDKVVELIYKTVFSRHPKARYRMAPNPFLIWLVVNVFGDKMLDKMFYKQISKLAKNKVFNYK